MPNTIYFDYNATTPLDPQVRAAMLPFLDEVWGNPSSVHHVGRRARALLDDARDRCAAVLGCKGSEVVFTSGGTESSNLAVFGTARLLRDKGRHLITSSIEHHAVLHCFDYLERKEGFTVTRLPVDSTGRVSVDDLRRALRPDTTLVSVMAANNETGTLQPVAELGALCRERGVLFHTDAVQATRNLVGVVVEFATGMEGGHNYFKGGFFLGFVHIDRDAPAVILDGGRTVLVERHRNLGRKPRQTLVGGIVDRLDKGVIGIDRVGVHPRPMQDRREVQTRCLPVVHRALDVVEPRRDVLPAALVRRHAYSKGSRPTSTACSATANTGCASDARARPVQLSRLLRTASGASGGRRDSRG